MSGLPLNHELTACGGRFLSKGETAPTYRLFALAGGPPKRPGLLRADTGEAVALEIWARPAAGFADFIANIPSPLSIGTIELSDGSRVKGFLVEPAGLTGAAEITELKGWRAFPQAENPGRTTRLFQSVTGFRCRPANDLLDAESVRKRKCPSSQARFAGCRPRLRPHRFGLAVSRP